MLGPDQVTFTENLPMSWAANVCFSPGPKSMLATSRLIVPTVPPLSVPVKEPQPTNLSSPTTGKRRRGARITNGSSIDLRLLPGWLDWAGGVHTEGFDYLRRCHRRRCGHPQARGRLSEAAKMIPHFEAYAIGRKSR